MTRTIENNKLILELDRDEAKRIANTRVSEEHKRYHKGNHMTFEQIVVVVAVRHGEALPRWKIEDIYEAAMEKIRAVAMSNKETA